VKLGIEAPKEVRVHRQEVFDAIQREERLKVTEVNSNRVQRELGETNRHVVDHIETTHLQPRKQSGQSAKRNGQPVAKTPNAQPAEPIAQSAKQNGHLPKHHDGYGLNPYMMGKPQRNGNGQSRNHARANTGRRKMHRRKSKPRRNTPCGSQPRLRTHPAPVRCGRTSITALARPWPVPTAVKPAAAAKLWEHDGGRGGWGRELARLF
jgi:hypothetical protein